MTKQEIESLNVFNTKNTAGFTDEEMHYLNEELIFDLITEIKEGFININDNQKIMHFVYKWIEHMWYPSFIVKKKGGDDVTILL